MDALAELGDSCVAVACGQQHSLMLMRRRVVSEDEPAHRVHPTDDGGGAACTGLHNTLLVGCGHAEFGQLGTGDSGGSGEAARDFPSPRCA